MAEYINKIGNLTVAEMPKAPTNIIVDAVYDNEFQITFNLSWILNMTAAQFPDDASGMWMQCVQEWNNVLSVWEDKEKIWNLIETTKQLTVSPNESYKHYRVITGKLNLTDGTYSNWLEIYPSAPYIAYCNQIIPLAIYDVANCNYCNNNGYENGWKWFAVPQNPQSPLNPWDTGWFEAWFSCTNPNTGFYGMMKIKQVSGGNTYLIGENDSQASEVEVGFNGVNYHFNATGVETIRIDCINDDKTTVGVESIITVPQAKHFEIPTDLNITYLSPTTATATWVNHAGDDFNENYICYIASEADENVKYCDNVYAPTNTAVIGGYQDNNFVLGQQYNLVVVTTKAGSVLKSQAFTYTHNA